MDPQAGWRLVGDSGIPCAPNGWNREAMWGATDFGGAHKVHMNFWLEVVRGDL